MEPPASGPERLFDAHRFPSDGFLLLALLLYAPVGLCLLLLRLFIGIHVFLVSCALPDSLLRRLGFIVRVMCSVLGLFVRQSDPHLRDASVRVYIANHVTHFDHSVISLLTSCNTLLAILNPGHDSAGGSASSEALNCCECGRLLLDHRAALDLLCSLHSLSSKLLAVELGVVSTRLTAADKAEHMKRLRHTPPHLLAPASSQSLVARPRASPSLAGVGPLAAEDVRITEMAQRVKEVLPHVSLGTIRRDLAQTNCVDTTIANLLEGRVPLLPEDKEPETGLLAPSTSQTSAVSSPQCPAASSSSKPSMKLFAKSPVERHLSLQERKHVLYAYARRRYTEKYGMPRGDGSH
ncbi:lipid droplet-regulating VLDL assembly factor AUP1 isoform X12 [Chelonia mydas]|uniref:lipid droplet-regulating VLDL assembly factor AUP1 isoform X12 n=1 Tax=Chelonia mydas TaxID=8469 RepID=UPI001CA8F1F4|nr:lipid droplet-regulating VLDL assembly factor AUP1 isoform X12 [Chelonia mydas]